MLGVDESAAGGDEPSGSGTTNGEGNLVVCLPGYLPNDAGTACVQQAVGDVVDTTKEGRLLQTISTTRSCSC